MDDAAVLRRLRVAGIVTVCAVAVVTCLQALFLVLLITHWPENDASLRQVFRISALVASVAILIGALVMHYFILLPNTRHMRENLRLLEERRERFSAMFKMNPNPVIAISAKGIVFEVNAAMEKLSGYSNSELIGKPPTSILMPEEVERTRNQLGIVLAGLTTHYTSVMLGKNGSRIEIEIDAIPIHVAGRVDGLYAILTDVTRERLLEERERTQRERLRSVSLLAAAHANNVNQQIRETLTFAVGSLGVDVVNVGVVQGDDLHVVHSSGSDRAWLQHFSFAKSFSRHIYGSHDILVIPDTEAREWVDDVARMWQPWRQCIATTLFVADEPAGVIIFVGEQPRTLPFDQADRDFVHVVGALVGASLERERREQQLTDMAFIDPLTGLPNRAYFFEQMQLAIAQAHRRGDSMAVHYIDLDEFKSVNDRLGHQAGDEALAVIAARLRAAARGGDILARLGGDEFAALQVSCPGDAEARQLAARVVAAVVEPVAIRGELVTLGASVGIARYPRDASTGKDLVRLADQAMYRAKRSGTNQTVLWEPEIVQPPSY